MSNDGWVIRVTRQGVCYVHRYFESEIDYPSIDDGYGMTFPQLSEAITYCLANETEYGFTVYPDSDPVKPPNLKRKRTQMDLQTFYRKSFEIQAVRITEENMEEVAKWCGGSIQQGKPSKDRDSAKFIHVDAHNPMNTRQTRGFLGDWVTCRGTAFKVYTDSALQSNYLDKPEDGIVVHNVFDTAETPTGAGNPTPQH